MYRDGLTKDISAELYLSLFHPDTVKDTVVHDKGVFSRNYSEDILSYDPDQNAVDLSRNGFLGVLPSELIAPERGNGAGNKRDSKELRERLALLTEAFAPIDTFNFRYNLAVEEKVKDLLSMKQAYILKEYYDFDLDSETDTYVAMVATLLPFASQLRGDLGFVKDLLETITHCEIRIRFSSYGEKDNSLCAMRKVHFDIIKDGLSPKDYREECVRFRKLSEFITEHFIPFDLACEIAVKGHRTEGNKILDYNYIVE